MPKTQICLFLLVFSIKQSSGKNYSNYTLYRGIPVNENHLAFFKNLTELYDASFWRPPGRKNMPVEFIIGPDDTKSFLRIADEMGLYITTILDNVQEAFDNQTVKPYIRRRTKSFDWQHYFRIEDIYQWLNDLSEIYPKQMTVMSIGKTHEDRHIMAVRVVVKGAKVRSKIIVEGGIHAREWISPAFVTYFLDQILHSPNSENKLLKKIAMSHEWYFVPVLNPDGYEYSHTEDRLWRKNRHDGDNGVDINRNFAAGFGTVGISQKPNSEIYCGPYAFSERESSAMRDFVQSQASQLEFYFGFHSYGQYMIIPYAYTREHIENFDEMDKMVDVAAAEIAKRHGIKYSHGTAFDTVGYMTSGVSGCWVKKTLKVPYVVTFELRDRGRFGFALPPVAILPTCQETMVGVLSIIDQGTSKSLDLSLHHESGQIKPHLDEFIIFPSIFGILYISNYNFM